MPISNKIVKGLVEKYKQISLLNKISYTLHWDLNVNLPLKASAGRANQSALITEIVTDKWLDPKFRQLLEKAQEESSLNEEEKAVVRNLQWESKYFLRVPKEVIVDLSRTTSEAFMVWQEARRVDKFEDFLPHLKKVIGLEKIVAEHLGYQDNPYDALLDIYERGLTSKMVSSFFGQIQPALTELLKKIKASKKYQGKNNLVGGEMIYPIQDQKQLAVYILKKMGYDLEAGRLDVSPHPFTTTLGRFDVRVTTRYNERDFRDSLTSSIHEAGHGLYELGVNPDYEDTPLQGGISIGVHESQSRFWENQVGRNPVFINFLSPAIQAFYQDQFAHTGSESLVKLLNYVEPSLIRVEADEVTYNLHIALRFELENALLNDQIKVEDLPEVWRAKMKQFLGVVPDTDREGVLQDVHWSYGSFGYFPTYTLGNLYAAQFTAKMREELNLEELLSKGELGTILSWLREHIHQYGSLYWPDELIKKVTGEKLNPQYFLDYLQNKYHQIYDLT